LDIFVEKSKMHYTFLDADNVFYPERWGYKVASLKLQGDLLLSPGVSDPRPYHLEVKGAIDYKPLFVAHQSPSPVKVACFQETCPVFCLGSKHDINTSYKWRLYESHSEFIDSPVIYVNQPGLYSCAVTYGDEMAESKVISVEIDPDLYRALYWTEATATPNDSDPVIIDVDQFLKLDYEGTCAEKYPSEFGEAKIHTTCIIHFENTFTITVYEHTISIKSNTRT
jgi:hypothetical protein